MIKMRDLLVQDEIFQQYRPTQTGRERTLLVQKEL